MTGREVHVVHVSLWNTQRKIFAGSQISGELLNIDHLKIDIQSMVEIKPEAIRFRKRNCDAISTYGLYFP